MPMAGIHDSKRRLALALLVPGIAANHEHHAAAADDLAILTNSFDAGADFHDSLSTCPT
jgi:hypothetical protein